MAGFHWSDYVVFCLVLAVSLGIGLFHAFTGGKQKKPSEYFLGNKELWLLPVAMSIVVSMVSSNSVLGVPTEVYRYGATYVWYGVSGGISFGFAATFFVPLLYPLGLTSIYQYFELRYRGKVGRILRLFGMFIQILTQIFFVGTVIWGPAQAMEVATDIPVKWLLLIIPLVGIIYSALGGIKGVVYTDAFQFAVIVIGQIVVIAVGIDKIGSASDVWDINDEWGRLEPDDDSDPTARSTLYSIFIGGFVTGLAAFGTNQAVIQRALGCKNLSRAQWSYVISGPLLLITQLIAVAVGWVVFAYYANLGCDPIKNGDVTRPDQILPFFLVDVVDYPTVPGLFFASVVCGSLSTISSSINAVTAILWNDVLSYCFGKLSELSQSFIRKGTAVLVGCAMMGMGYILEERASDSTLVSIVFSGFGALQGPMLAMFLFAGLLPFVSGFGALCGGILALSTTIWMTIGRVDLGASFQALSVPEMSCPGYVLANGSASVGADDDDDRTDLEWFYSISFWYYPLICIIIVFVIGTIASLPWIRSPKKVEKKYLFPIIRGCAGTDDGEKNDEEAITEKY